MSGKQIQLEIFQLDQKNKKMGRADSSLSEKSLEPKFPTQLCIKAASLVIVIIMSFALGIERGKVISRNRIPNSLIATDKPQNISQDIAQEVSLTTKEIVIKNDEIKKTPVATKKLQKQEKDDSLRASKYVIQVVTYKKDSSYIEKEIAKLKLDGYSTMVIPSGNWIQICAGKFADEKDAQTHLRKLKQTYKDCKIRKI